MRAGLLGCAGMLLGALDFGFMTLAGPAIDRTLDLGAAYPWLFSASSFAYGAVLVPAGWLAERRGPCTVFRAGVTLYVGGLAAVAVATELHVLFAGRAVLGIGGGMLTPAALALLAGVRGRRGLAFASSGGAVAAGFVSGVLLGSLVVEEIGWRWALLGLCPPIVALSVATRGVGEGAVPSRRRAPGASTRPAGALAIASAAILAAAGLDLASRVPVAFVAMLGAAAAVMRGGLRRATRPPAGWLPSGIQGQRLGRVCVAGAATTASGVGGAALLGRALSTIGGLSPAQTGLALAAFGVTLPLAVPAARALAASAGAARGCGVGLAIQAAALAALAALPLTEPAPVTAAIAAFGAGHVVANAGAVEAAMELARRAGETAGLLATAQYVGAGVGAVVMLGIAGGDVVSASGVRVALLLGAVVAVAGALTVFMPPLSFTYGRQRKANGTQPHLLEAPGDDSGRGIPPRRVCGRGPRARGS